MVPFKGRLSFRQYMPAKPTKWGIKLWSLCESTTGYMYNFQVYTGKEQGQGEQGLSFRIVAKLCSCIYNSFCTVVFDNFYTGIEILKHLFLRGLYACGTIRSNRKGLPTELKNVRLNKHEYRLAQFDDLTFVVWKDTKNVSFLSNFHTPTAIGQVNRRGQDRRQQPVDVPTVICDYQTHMRGVDLCDQKVGYYLPLIKSFKWWRRLFFYLLQVSIVNCYIMAKSANNDVLMRFPEFRDFLERLAHELIGNHRAKREVPIVGNPQNGGLHPVRKLFAKKKVCHECKLTKPDILPKNKMTEHGCESCNIPVHLKCQVFHVKRMCPQ